MFSSYPPSLPSPTLAALEACFCDCRASISDHQWFSVREEDHIYSITIFAGFWLPLVAHDETGLMNFKRDSCGKLGSEIAILLWTKVCLKPRKGVVEKVFS